MPCPIPVLDSRHAAAARRREHAALPMARPSLQHMASVSQVWSRSIVYLLNALLGDASSNQFGVVEALLVHVIWCWCLCYFFTHAVITSSSSSVGATSNLHLPRYTHTLRLPGESRLPTPANCTYKATPSRRSLLRRAAAEPQSCEAA